jgi:hypothetical protein
VHISTNFRDTAAEEKRELEERKSAERQEKRDKARIKRK